MKQSRFTDEQIIGLLKQADAGMSVKGTLRALLEVAVMGRPLVAIDVPGFREVLRHGFNGLLCRLRDSLGLADQLHTILQMPAAKLVQMGHASRLLVEERFDEQLVIDAYLQVLDEIF